ncbi:MAG: hypothetical protein U0869_19425 [Chloroflexota bacterium]
MFSLRLASSPRLALALTLAAGILATIPAVPAAATAATFTAPRLQTAAIDGGIVSATVPGTIRTGVWRLTIRKPGATERIRVFIERGDVAWGGWVAVQRNVAGTWSTVSRSRLDDAGELRRTVCAPAIGACVPAGTVIAPHPGAQDLESAFRITGRGTWVINGAVRQASEPFIYGRWLSSGRDDLRF